MKTQKNNFKPKPIKLEIKEYKNKYRLAAEEIHQILGAGNYENVYNCMTRFRANVTDRKKVNLDQIKKIPLVKGVQWNGDELQIIIGGEVVKVVDEFKKYEEELLNPTTQSTTGPIQIKEKISVGRKIMGAIAGIMGPSIGILMASGLMGALYALLTLPDGNNALTTIVQTGVDTSGKPIMVSINMGNLYLFDIWSSIFFVLKSVILNLIGLFFIYNTTKYFKGNTIFAIAVGLTMVSRGFFPAINTENWDTATFGDWTGNMGKSGFLLFKLGEYPILVGGYEGSVIPFIVAGIVISYLDRWIKTWMPSVVDIIFRPTLVYFVSLIGIWFLLGPISGLVEYGLILGMQWIGKIPYGFGTGLFAMFWQPLVLTGSHVAVVMPLVTDLANGNPQPLYAAISLGVWGQVGAAIGVAIITKNMNLRRVAIGGITGGIFGVTEPIIYGVTLLKVRPFFLGCLGGFIGGFVQGNIGIAVVRQGGLGILGILGFEVWDIPWVLMLWVISIGTSILLVVFLYKERKDEFSYFKKGVNKLIKFTESDKISVNKEFEIYEKEIKAMKNDYKKISKYYSEISKYENQLLSLENKESKQREKMHQELVKLRSKIEKKENHQQLLEKFNKLNQEYSDYNLDQEKDKIQTQINSINQENNELLTKVEKAKTQIYTKSTTLVKKYQAKLTKAQLMTIENIMWNALDSVEIGFGINDPRPVKFKKEVQ